MGKDYYKILDVGKDASSEEIKKAFRKLAHQYHPDKQSGNEAKFKEINEAYQVLGNEEKRKRYDQFGADFAQQGGFGGGKGWEDFMRAARGGGFGNEWQQTNVNFGDLGDIFGDLFGGFGFDFSNGSPRKSKSRKQQGSDVELHLTVSFREAAFGAEKTIRLHLHAVCEHCNGNCAEPGTKIVSCKQCKGTGQITQVQRTVFGAFQTTTSCHECYGEGKIAEKPCSACRGSGIEKRSREITVRIPGGIATGETLRLVGQGEAGLRGGPAGDVYLRITVEEHQRFRREGSDIYSKVKIPVTLAMLGGTIEVETLDNPVTLKVPAGTESGKIFRLKGHGAKLLHESGRGDQYVELSINIPHSISKKQKKILDELRKEGL